MCTADKESLLVFKLSFNSIDSFFCCTKAFKFHEVWFVNYWLYILSKWDTVQISLAIAISWHVLPSLSSRHFRISGLNVKIFHPFTVDFCADWERRIYLVLLFYMYVFHFPTTLCSSGCLFFQCEFVIFVKKLGVCN